jgi:hypothetical protein
MFVFGLTWEPVSWIYPPEVNVLGLRHVGAAAAAGSEWLFAFVTGKFSLFFTAWSSPKRKCVTNYASSYGRSFRH